MILIILLIASIITACVSGVKKMFKDREFNALTITSVANVVILILLFVTG